MFVPHFKRIRFDDRFTPLALVLRYTINDV